ncbi:MAG TPA: nucleoside triphosphate pyrophosphohydrolase [Pseudomonadales bacterium]|nr:nucleoside triphosphate pyrophosphohydrolase [Pseudomonadales bacterium]
MADIEKLLVIMRQLRDPDNGCPWDLQQDFLSLLPYTLEEVYEVIDAIECADYRHLSEELGDLLFQIVFYAQIGSERGLFDMAAIIDGIAAKLLIRHPHVFQREDDIHPDMQQLHTAWEARKQQDRAEKGIDNLLGDIPLALPALQRAHKIQSRLARAGFDWPSTSGVIAQVRLELDELERAMQQNDIAACCDELGDVLFSCVNLARHLDIDAEVALRSSNTKVSQRIGWMEKTLRQRQDRWSDKTMAELEVLWQGAKQSLKGSIHE